MTLLPVIERELRAESRSAFTYWLRVTGGAALMGAGLIYFVERGVGSMDGEDLFRMMHVTLFVAIWIVSILMTADSISRERREGTLGLLFLTPLRPFEVVLAKGLAHGLRAVTILLAAVPVLVVPFLMGGVGWREALAAVLIDLSALCWALAAGLLASSFNRSMSRSLVWAAIIALCALVLLVHVHGAAVVNALRPGFGWQRGRVIGAEHWMQIGWDAIFRSDASRWVLRGNPDAWLGALAVIALASIVSFGLVVAVAALGIKRVAKDRPKSAARQRVEKELFTPTFGLGFYRRWMRRVLERNPVGWLERRTWQSRLITWSWLAVVISMISWMLQSRTFYRGGFSALNMFLAWVLVANVALTAAGSLRRERETGVIELLLVSPLSIPQIVGGRLRSIVVQFLPAAALIFGTWLWLLHAFAGIYVSDERIQQDVQMVGFFLATLLSLPVVGLYFSLRCRVFLIALFLTVVTSIALPWLIALGVSVVAAQGPDTRVAQYWQVGMGFLAVIGAMALLRWRGAGSRGLKWALAVAFAALGAISLIFGMQVDQWHIDGPGLAALFVYAGVQITIAAWLGSRLRRCLETRRFALPQ